MLIAVAAACKEPPRHGSRNSYRRPVVAPTAEAFERGGVPPRDAAIEALLVDVERAVASVGVAPVDPPAITARGEALASAWRGFAEPADRWIQTAPALREQQLEDDLRRGVQLLDEAFVAARVGYQVELRLWREDDSRNGGVIVHRVDEIVFVTANGQPRRVLGLRRADGVIVARGALGLETPELGSALMLDPIASYAVTDVLPVMIPGAPFDRSAAGAAAGEAVRAELAAVLGKDAPAAARIAALIAERKELLYHWKSIRQPQLVGLFLDDKQLARAEGEPGRARVDAIEAEMDRLGAGRIAARLEQLVAASVRRHEVQHAVDLARATELPYPAALEAIAGPLVREDGEPRRALTFARAELAAYLSQLVNDPITPHLTLWGVVTFAFKSPNGSAGRAGRVIVEGLARQLGAPGGGLVAAATTCAAATGDQLRAAGRALWTELYGEAVVVIADR